MPMTAPEAAVLPDPQVKPTMTIEEAGRLFGIGRSLAYELAARGEFPVPVLRLGKAYRVPTAPALAKLGLGTEQPA